MIEILLGAAGSAVSLDHTIAHADLNISPWILNYHFGCIETNLHYTMQKKDLNILGVAFEQG